MVPAGTSVTHSRRIHPADFWGAGGKHKRHGLCQSAAKHKLGQPDCLVVLVAIDHPLGDTPRPDLVYGLPDGVGDFSSRKSRIEAQAPSLLPFRLGDHGILHSHSVHRDSHTCNSSSPFSHGCLHDNALGRGSCHRLTVLTQHVLRPCLPCWTFAWPLRTARSSGVECQRQFRVSNLQGQIVRFEQNRLCISGAQLRSRALPRQIGGQHAMLVVRSMFESLRLLQPRNRGAPQSQVGFETMVPGYIGIEAILRSTSSILSGDLRLRGIRSVYRVVSHQGPLAVVADEHRTGIRGEWDMGAWVSEVIDVVRRLAGAILAFALRRFSFHWWAPSH